METSYYSVFYHKIQCSHESISKEQSGIPSTIPLLCIPFSPMCPSRWCHKMVESTTQEDLLLVSETTAFAHPWVSVIPNSLYSVPVWTPLINTIAPRTILHESFSNKVCTPAFPILLTDVRFRANPGICNTPGRVPFLPSFNISHTFTFFVRQSWSASRRPAKHHRRRTYRTCRTNLCSVSYDKMPLS